MHVRPITAIPPVQTRARYYKTAHLTPFHTQPARQPKSGGVVPLSKQRRKRPGQHRPLSRPHCSLVEMIRQQEAHPGCRGRRGCLLHSGHNHWSVLEKVVTLKVSRSSTPCIDHWSRSQSHMLKCIQRGSARDGRTAMHIQPWRFAQRRFIVATSFSRAKYRAIGRSIRAAARVYTAGHQ